MQIETKTWMKLDAAGGGLVVLDVLFKPRGSGNRNTARRVAQAFRRDPVLKPHIRKVVVGSSRVTVHLVASMELARVMWSYKPQRDLPGQMIMFPEGKIATA